MHWFTWFDGIFNAASDRARLVTVIISAIVAVTVVIFNQRLTANREWKAFLAQKLEEVFDITIKLEALTDKLATNSHELNANIGSPTFNKSERFDIGRDGMETILSYLNKINLISSLFLKKLPLLDEEIKEKNIVRFLGGEYFNDEGLNKVEEAKKIIIDYVRKIQNNCIDYKL